LRGGVRSVLIVQLTVGRICVYRFNVNINKETSEEKLSISSV